MGRNGQVRHSSQYQLRPGEKRSVETDLHGPFARLGHLLHRHDQTSRTERQNRRDDRPVTIIELLPFRQLSPLLLPFHR